jgi:hypothetical protein
MCAKLRDGGFYYPRTGGSFYKTGNRRVSGLPKRQILDRRPGLELAGERADAQTRMPGMRGPRASDSGGRTAGC